MNAISPYVNVIGLLIFVPILMAIDAIKQKVRR